MGGLLRLVQQVGACSKLSNYLSHICWSDGELNLHPRL